MSHRPKSHPTDVEAVKRFQKKYAPNARQDFQIIRTWPPATAMHDSVSRKRRYQRLITGVDCLGEDFPSVSPDEAREIMSRKKPRGSRKKLPLEQDDSSPIAIPLPDPWLFDTQQLLNELDRCRELILRIPAPTNQMHFQQQTAVDALWRLRDTMRELLRIYREGQQAFQKRGLLVHPKARKKAEKPKIVEIRA